MKNELKELLAQCTPYSANRKWKASVHPDYTMRLYSGKKQICIAPMEDANPSMQVSDFDLLARAPALAARVIALENILAKILATCGKAALNFGPGHVVAMRYELYKEAKKLLEER